jgi:hypothetical protein
VALPLVALPNLELMTERSELSHELIAFDTELRTLDVALDVAVEVVRVVVVVVPVG